MSSKYVILWHGTSESRADNIAKTGFHANSFFAKSVGISWGYASAKGKLDDPGVLVLCAIDLNLYKKTEYDIRRGREYHFIPAISRDVVAGIFKIDNFTRGELTDEARLLKMKIRRYRRLRSRQPEIVITRNCSIEAIIYWINTYLSGRTDKRVEAMHPGIKPIRIWVEKNYTNGRISPISEQGCSCRQSATSPISLEISAYPHRDHKCRKSDMTKVISGSGAYGYGQSNGIHQAKQAKLLRTLQEMTIERVGGS